MTLPKVPMNDGWTDVEYDLGDLADNARIGAILNEACHVFRYHSGGTWATHDKDAYAQKLVDCDGVPDWRVGCSPPRTAS